MKIFENLDEIKQKAKGLEEKVGQTIGDIEDKIGQSVEAVEAKVDLPELNFNHSDIMRDRFMLQGKLAEQGYDLWWHSFTGHNSKTGEERAFFVVFYTINPALGKEEPVWGQTEEHQKNHVKPSYMMVKVGCWGEHPLQLHRFFAWDDMTVKEDAPYLISADNCFCSETRTLGMVDVSQEEAEMHPEYMSDAGRMYWDLTMDKKIAFNVGYGANESLRDAEPFDMFWHCEGMKTAFEGKVVLNGEEYLVSKEDSYGYADKIWGRDFTNPWVWLSSNDLTRKSTGEKLTDSAFVIGGGRPKVGSRTLENQLMGAMWYEGEAFEFNFAKVWTLTKTKFKCKETKNHVVWRVVQETPMSKMCTEISCKKEEMLFANYETPDGEKRHDHLWNGGNGSGTIRLYRKHLRLKKDGDRKKWDWELVDEITVAHAGCEYGQYEK